MTGWLKLSPEKSSKEVNQMNQKQGAKKIPESKLEAVAEIKEKIGKAAGLALVDYKGLSVAQDTELRNEMRKNKVEYKVVKNKLLRIAFRDLGIDGLDGFLEGPTAVALSYDDAVAAARVSAQNIAKFNKLSLKAGYAEGRALNTDEVVALSKIPGRDVLIAMLLGMLTMPVRGLAVAMSKIAEGKS